MPKRIAIFGNAGSGKSYLAKTLAEQYELPLIQLDDIFWADSFYVKKRDSIEVERKVKEQALREAWIMEGVYGELMELLLDYAEQMIWVDMDWATCKKALLNRHKEQPEKVENFQALLDYAAQYWARNNMRSYKAHQALLEQFKGESIRLSSRAEVNAYIGRLTQGI